MWDMNLFPEESSVAFTTLLLLSPHLPTPHHSDTDFEVTLIQTKYQEEYAKCFWYKFTPFFLDDSQTGSEKTRIGPLIASEKS